MKTLSLISFDLQIPVNHYIKTWSQNHQALSTTALHISHQHQAEQNVTQPSTTGQEVEQYKTQSNI